MKRFTKLDSYCFDHLGISLAYLGICLAACGIVILVFIKFIKSQPPIKEEQPQIISIIDAYQYLLGPDYDNFTSGAIKNSIDIDSQLFCVMLAIYEYEKQDPPPNSTLQLPLNIRADLLGESILDNFFQWINSEENTINFIEYLSQYCKPYHQKTWINNIKARSEAYLSIHEGIFNCGWEWQSPDQSRQRMPMAIIAVNTNGRGI